MINIDIQRLPKRVSAKKAARIIGKSDRLMRQWRKLGKGPPYVRIGKHVMYEEHALSAWLAQCGATTTGTCPTCGAPVAPGSSAVEGGCDGQVR